MKMGTCTIASPARGTSIDIQYSQLNVYTYACNYTGMDRFNMIATSVCGDICPRVYLIKVNVRPHRNAPQTMGRLPFFYPFSARVDKASWLIPVISKTTTMCLILHGVVNVFKIRCSNDGNKLFCRDAHNICLVSDT